MRPERDALEIRFPRVEGYRVELPEERLTAAFNDDSDPDAEPRPGRPVDHPQLRHHRRRRRHEPQHLGDVRTSTLVFELTSGCSTASGATPARSRSCTCSASSSASPDSGSTATWSARAAPIPRC
jgi:type III restriction enzyme